jgi:hypothetical protein
MGPVSYHIEVFDLHCFGITSTIGHAFAAIHCEPFIVADNLKNS